MSTPLSYSEGASLPSTAPQWAIAASKRLQQRRNDGYKSDLQIPDGVKKVLLHSCCAPCSGAMVSNDERWFLCCFDSLYGRAMTGADVATADLLNLQSTILYHDHSLYYNLH